MKRDGKYLSVDEGNNEMNATLSKYLVWGPLLLSRGQNIWPQLRTLKKSQYLPAEQIAARQFTAFKEIVTYAYNNVPLYRTKYQQAGLFPEDIRTEGDIGKIPLLTKQEIMDEPFLYNQAFTGRRFKRSTSGSTGKPLVFYKDNEAMTTMDAIQYRNYSWYGVGLGDRQARFWGHPLTKIGMAKTRLLDCALNRKRLSPFNLHESTYQRYLKQIENFRADYVYGYAQSIFQFCNYYSALDLDLSYLKIKAVILTGEMIYPQQMEVINKVFNCPVTQEYGCTELGLIGFGCRNGTMHLMENLMVESLPAKAGENYGEIIVSELYGRLFPFIRYRLGDKGAISSRSCSCGRGLRVLEHLSGRKDDFIVCPDGRLIDSYLVEYTIDEMPKKIGSIQQFKVVQKEYCALQILLQATGNKEMIIKYIGDSIQKILPASMNVQVDLVNELPKELSGKLRCFISLIKVS